MSTTLMLSTASARRYHRLASFQIGRDGGRWGFLAEQQARTATLQSWRRTWSNPHASRRPT